MNVGGIFKVRGKRFYVAMKQFLGTVSLSETALFQVTFLLGFRNNFEFQRKLFLYLKLPLNFCMCKNIRMFAMAALSVGTLPVCLLDTTLLGSPRGAAGHTQKPCMVEFSFYGK